VAGSPLFEIRSVMNAPTPCEDGDPMDDADIRRPGKVGRRRSEALAQRRQLWSVYDFSSFRRAAK
jgi:hypothetical protein